MSEANDFLMRGGTKSAAFPTVGTTVTGVITCEPEVRQQTDPKDGSLKFWPDGKPRNQLVVTLATELRDPENPDDDGERALYVKGNMQQAVRDAIRASGAQGIAAGGTLTVTYSGNGKANNAAFSPPKLYTATYAPPPNVAANEFLNGGEQQAPAPPVPAPVPQPVATPPAAPPPGVSPEAFAALQRLSPTERAALGL